MKKLIVFIMSLVLINANAQKNWSGVDFIKECKVDTKMPGGVAKSFRNNPVFVNDYYIMQASLMKGSSKAGMMQKQGVGAVFAEAALAGITKEAMQALIEELHIAFLQDLKDAGLNIVDGDEILQSEYAMSRKDDKKAWIGKTDGEAIFDKVGGMDASAYDTKERLIFRPKDMNIFVSTATIAGNFYQKLATKETVNLLSIGYSIKFADFEGSKTVTKNKLTTTAGLTVTPLIMIANPAGLFCWVTYNKPAYGNNDWSNGLVELKSRDGSFWGLSSSADYAIEANEGKYIAELKDIVLNLQKNLAQHIKAEIQ
jgi:hypothetical protein